MAYVPIERISLGLAAVVLVGLTASPSNAQQKPAPAAAAPLEVIKLRDNVHAIVGGGATVVLQVGPDGAILVDSGSGQRSADVLAEIRKITNRPIRYIINTSADREHVGGNDDLSKAGQSVIPTGGLNEIGAAGGRAPILAEEHVQAAMTAPHGEQAPYPVGAWPTVTYSSDLMEMQKDLYFNGEAIITTYQPNAFSDGDSVVFFRRSDVLVTGEVYDPTRFPRIDLQNGGSIQGIIDALNRIIAITVPPIPLIWQEGGTVVVGAHGTIGHEADVVDYRDMVTIIRDRFQDAVKKKMTLEQVKAARLVRDYEPRYGAAQGFWTTDAFVEAAYRSMSQPAVVTSSR